MEKYIDKIYEMVIEYIPHLIGAVLTLIIGFWIIAWITRSLERVLEKRNIDATIRPFLTSIVSVGLKVILLISVASMFGFKTTSVIAIFSALAFAIGLALQGSLGHFASGVLILIFKPYKVGDVIEVKGSRGAVVEIQIFNTVLKTGDNKRIIIPNGVVTSGVIINVTGQPILRVDMTFGIGYNDDIDKSRLIIQQVIDSCDLILKDRPADILISALADSSVNFAVRPWVERDNYWPVYWYMHEQIKKQFDANDIGIPFPQMDVHMHKVCP